MGRVRVSGLRSKRGVDNTLTFGEIPEKFPESAVPVTYEEASGEGWLVTHGLSIVLVWRYPDGYILTARLTSWTSGGATAEQVEGFQRVMEQVIPRVPEVAAAHVDPVIVPSPTPTPNPTP